MNRIIAVLTGALLLIPISSRADEAQALVEIRELKQLMEAQMKRIDELTVEVGRLHQAVQAQRAALAPGPEPKRDVVVPPAFAGFSEMKPGATTKIEQPKAEASAQVAVVPPKAEAVNGVKHTVAKGETLTSIAKSYNITLAELMKANKDVNDRKLQIGQTITVPVTKAPEPNPTEPASTEKKETP